MKLLRSFFITASFGVFFASCSKDKTITPETPSTPKHNIAFVFNSDNTEALAFRELMKENGCAVILVDESKVNGFDFSTCKMVVVGNNTSDNWAHDGADSIHSSGKPVLLLGMGGLKLAEKLNNTVNWGVCMSFSQTSLHVVDPASSLFKSPKSIAVPAGNKLQLFNNPGLAEGFHMPAPLPDVNGLGRDINNPEHYTVTFEDNRYGMFGFGGSVDAMTQTGKDFMVNLVYFVGKLTP